MLETRRNAGLSMDNVRSLIRISGLVVCMTCFNSDARSQNSSQLENENLIVALPQGFIVATQSAHDGM